MNTESVQNESRLSTMNCVGLQMRLCIKRKLVRYTNLGAWSYYCAVCVQFVCGLCAVCVRFVCGLCAVCVRTCVRTCVRFVCGPYVRRK